MNKKDTITLSNIGLVLEGGGMRGLYTSGVLDYFLEKNIEFPYVIGVSAGAIMSASYISGQKGRNLETQLRFINDKRYMGISHLLKNGSYFNYDFSYKEIPDKLVPFDFDKFFSSKIDYRIGLFDCNTGKSRFIPKSEIKDKERLMKVLQASGSLPFISKIVHIDDEEYLDGGLKSQIPLNESINDGNKKNVVVLTREKGYLKTAPKFQSFTKLYYRNYPEVVKILKNRYQIYNDNLKVIEDLEEKGEIFVIRPRNKVLCDRLEKNPAKLTKLYFDALRDMDYYYDDLMTWLTK
ncbi:MAG: patatin family protein [Candidatus Delongbacteria bacterium]|jgi:predicted patatin/cPLA2 family phospholipase|nr:patatin family protein [Candidatus Delongbacteria bacterium]